jgi:hypothetical protein
MCDCPLASFACASGLWGRLLGVLLLAAAAGCLDLHPYRPVAVLVQDAETKKPIAGAEVRVCYPISRASLSPCESTGLAEDNGIAQVRMAPAEGGATLEATARGYLTEILNVPEEAVRKLEPAHLFEDTDRRPARFVLELYAGPHPTVELVLPTSFRGLVKAEVEIQEDAPLPPGQRCFRFSANPVGSSVEVRVVGPPLLRRVNPTDYRACYADGTVLSPKAGPEEVGFRPLKCARNIQLFVVGTQSEYEGWQPARQSREENRPAGGGRGSRGGHHRGRPEPDTP